MYETSAVCFLGVVALSGRWGSVQLIEGILNAAADIFG